MARKPPENSRQRQARIAFLLLTIIPILPEIVIWGTSTIAQFKGCKLDQSEACLIGPLAASEIISFALRAAGVPFVAGLRASASLVWIVVLGVSMTAWLVACYIALTRGWARTGSRLSLGFAVAIFFAVLPYLGPVVAVGNLGNEKCQPTRDVVNCKIFGGVVGGADPNLAYDTINFGLPALVGGALLALSTFVIYAVVVVVMSAKRRAASG